MKTKECTKCREMKELCFFHKMDAAPDGFCCHCKACVAVKDRKRYSEHRDKIIEYQKKYRSEHRDEINERSKKYNYEHKDERIEYQKKYYSEHRDEINERRRKRYSEQKT